MRIRGTDMAKIMSKQQEETTMLKHILMTITMATMLCMGTMNTALAMISEPDVVYYGTAAAATSGSRITIDRKSVV